MTMTNPKFDVAAEIQKLGDPNLPEGVVDGRTDPPPVVDKPKGRLLLGPETETIPEPIAVVRARAVSTPFKGNAHPPQDGGLDYGQIPAGETNDRRCQELFDFGQRELQRQVINDRVTDKIIKSMVPAEVDSKDIAYTLALYGGRVEVKNFGSFYVKEITGYYRRTGQGGRHQYFVPGRRSVMFFPSDALLALLNENYYGNQIEPTPNADFFIERRNLILE